MEKEDGFDLVPRLNFRKVENDLERDCGEKEEIVPREAEEGDVIREKEKDEKRAGKYARPRLFEAKKDEFPRIRYEGNSRGRQKLIHPPTVLDCGPGR